MLAKHETSNATHINMEFIQYNGKSFDCNKLSLPASRDDVTCRPICRVTMVLLTNKLLISIVLPKFINILLMDASTM